MLTKEKRISVGQSQDHKIVHFNASADPPSPREATKQIQFHIDRLTGLSIGSAIAIEKMTSEERPLRETTNKGKKLKSGDVIVWEVNLPQMTLTESSKIRFVVEGRSVVGKRPVIGYTTEHTIGNLLELMERSEQESKDIRDAYLKLKVDCPSSHQNVTLHVKVRELPTESTAKETAARTIKQAAEKYKRESLKVLERMEEGIRYFSDALMGTDKARCMADVMHGALTAVKTPCESDQSHCARVVVCLLETISAIFDQYRSMTSSQLFGESHSVLLNEMFVNVIKGLWTIVMFMSAEFLERAHLEFKVSAWMTYFKSLQPYLLDTQQTKPSPPEQSRRVTNLPDLNAKSSLPSLDRLETHLPAIIEERTDLYYQTPIQLISQWVLASADDPNKIFCLSGVAGCGKSYLAGEIVKAFSELGFFGAYFSFNHHSRKDITSQQLLDSFPVTIMQRIAAVEPDAERLMAQETKTLSATSETLESKFEKLVVNPLRNLRSNSIPSWQPDYPLLIVLDDLNICTSEVLEQLLNLLSGPIMEKLPSHIRFLALSRPSEEVNRRIGQVGFEIHSSPNMPAEESNYSTFLPAERQETTSGNSSVHSGWTTPNLFGQASIQAF